MTFIEAALVAIKVIGPNFSTGIRVKDSPWMTTKTAIEITNMVPHQI